VTGIDWKVFLRALSWPWYRGNRWRFDGDMTEWSLWHSFLIYNYKMECGKVSRDFVTMSQLVWWMVTDGHVTVCHMMRVTWGPWESKRIATVVKCISSREMSENSIEFSLSNSEQRDSWLNSGHWTLDANILLLSMLSSLNISSLISLPNLSAWPL